MPTITAKIKCSKKEPQGADQVSLGFQADYEDGRNKEWAKYTPGLSLTMGVKPEVAEHFAVGQAYTLTFDPDPE